MENFFIDEISGSSVTIWTGDISLTFSFVKGKVVLIREVKMSQVSSGEMFIPPKKLGKIYKLAAGILLDKEKKAAKNLNQQIDLFESP